MTGWLLRSLGVSAVVLALAVSSNTLPTRVVYATPEVPTCANNKCVSVTSCQPNNGTACDVQYVPESSRVECLGTTTCG